MAMPSRRASTRRYPNGGSCRRSARSWRHGSGLAPAPGEAAAPWKASDGWRVGASAPWTTTIGRPDAGLATVGLTVDGPGFKARVDNGVEHTADLRPGSEGEATMVLDGVEHR